MIRHTHLTLVALLLLGACANKQPAVTGEPAPTVVKYAGTVTLKAAGDGCPLLVILDGGDKQALIPVGLDKRYQQEGLRLKFTYRPSRASSGECGKGSPAILEDISVMGEAGK
ncbi:MAG: hypothetical protein JNL05_07960 [Flavobacteriales bacterium]|nr:hypothetical protein [Flavobacteriales bacterium]